MDRQHFSSNSPSNGIHRTSLERRHFVLGLAAAAAGSAAGCVTDDQDGSDAAAPLIEEGFADLDISPPVESEIVVVESSQAVQAAQLIKAEFESTDLFEITVAELEFGTYLDRLMNAPTAEDQAIFSVSWGGGWDPIDYTTPLFHSDQGVPDGFNVNHYSDETVDELLEEGVTSTAQAERVDTYDTLQAHLLEDVPVSVVRFGEEYHVWDRDDVADWQTYPIPADAFRPIYDPATGVATEVTTSDAELVVDLPSAVLAFDPTRMEDTTSLRATALVYEPVLRMDFEGTPQPVLAENWEYRDDTTLRVRLRDGVRFHNGETLSTDHVIGTLERYPGTVRDAVVSDWYDGATAVDSRTVDLALSQSYAPLEARLGSIPILPHAVIDGDHDPADGPIGTGPFQFGEHQPDTLFRLERFGDHWFEGSDSVPAIPPVETVTFRIIVDSSARQAALEAGDTDLSTALPPASLADFEADEAYGTDRATTGGFEFLVYPLYTAPFSSRKVRQGCDRLVPRSAIIEAVYHEIGEPGYTPISPLLEPYSSTDKQQHLAEEHGVID